MGTDNNTITSLIDLIHRARNHPSIICWSLANTAGSDDVRLTKALQVMNECVKKEDPTRPTAFACEENGDANKSGFALVTDIMGYNGGGMGKDDKDHELYPLRKMMISEFSSGRGARGNYKSEPVGETKTEKLGDGRVVSRTGHLTSIYDLCLSHEKEWRHIAERPFMAGGCMWSGIEYTGETNGWPVVTSQFGVLDLCRFKKDTYYYYLQEWTDKPMVHIFPHWNWNKGDTINVWCYSNCTEVELFLNGKSLGRKTKVPLGHIEWKVPFQSGILSAEGLNNNKAVAGMQIKTAGKPSLIKTSADRNIIKADGNDLSFITVTVCDKDGNMVPTADNLVEVQVSGGKLLGVCSGDPIAHDAPASGKIKIFNGMLLAVVQSNEHPGKILVTVKSEGLTSNLIDINAK
jgi:beta-galactosidase